MRFRTVVASATLVFASRECEAAVVRDLHAIPAASATSIVVDVEGEYAWRTHRAEDGGTVYIEIEEATIGDDAPRMLPVSDGRVDGIIVADDESARSVRIAVDIAGKVAPRLDAAADGSKLVLTFVDGAPGDAHASSTKKGATPRRDSTPPESPRPASRNADRAARAAARHGNAATESKGGKTGSSESATTASAPPASRRSVLERPVVILDPGHGGKDPGAKAWTGEYEKDIVLDLADRIARRLRASGQVEVVMTRSGDEYVSLADRRDSSRRWNADAFVSIHANASQSGTARGFTTYYHPRATGAGAKGGDREARRLARLENSGMPANSAAGGAPSRRRAGSAAARRASLEGSPILNPHAESIRLARAVQDELVRRLEMRYEAVRDLGAKEGPFFVINENAAPSVLVEAAFLTHREEGVRMRSEVYREQIADGVARGILAFLEHQQTAGTL